MKMDGFFIKCSAVELWSPIFRCHPLNRIPMPLPPTHDASTRSGTRVKEASILGRMPLPPGR